MANFEYALLKVNGYELVALGEPEQGGVRSILVKAHDGTYTFAKWTEGKGTWIHGTYRLSISRGLEMVFAHR